MTPSGSSAQVTQAFMQHQRLLWGLAYRMTGSAADADDVVQDTFERALDRPPSRVDEPLRPWLVSVAMNLARDTLRRRKRQIYVGPWLPSPVEGTEPTTDAADAHYDLRESASYAFLLALEALTPAQRGVLLLRDVFDCPVRDTAQTLGLSESNVKVIHHRARRAMELYDRTRRPLTATLQAETRAALEQFLSALASGDAAAAEACLASDARLLSDGGGEYVAALRPVLGADRVQRFLSGLYRKHAAHTSFAVRTLNGLPAIVAEQTGAGERWAPRFVIRCELNARGGIREVHLVVASAKLTGVSPL